MSATGVKACCKSNPNIWNMIANKAGEHTQGEWKVDNGKNNLVVVEYRSRDIVCNIPNGINALETAKLIASAPKMLEALEKIAQAAEKGTYIKIWAESAIKSAKGE